MVRVGNFLRSIASFLKEIFQVFVVTVFTILAFGTLHQIKEIREKRSIGAISMLREYLVLLKDITGVLFGFSMGLAAGWPVIYGAGLSALLRMTVIYHYYWTKSSPVTAKRAEQFAL